MNKFVFNNHVVKFNLGNFTEDEVERVISDYRESQAVYGGGGNSYNDCDTSLYLIPGYVDVWVVETWAAKVYPSTESQVKLWTQGLAAYLKTRLGIIGEVHLESPYCSDLEAWAYA